MNPTFPVNSILVAVRLPRSVQAELRDLADREQEKQSVVLRRIIKLGLESVARPPRDHEAA